MMYIEHTNLEDNLHQILTNREPTYSSPSASEATAAVAGSALLARVREAHHSASSSLQHQTTSSNAQYLNNSSSTPNHYITAAKDSRRPEPNLLPLERIESIGITHKLRSILTRVENTAAFSRKEVQSDYQPKKEEEEEEQYELLQVVDSDQTAQAEISKSLGFLTNGRQEEIRNCASSHFVIETDGQKIASSETKSRKAPLSRVQVDENEEFEYVITRVPKRKLQETSQAFENYSTLNHKLRRPVPEAIPIESDPRERLHNGYQPPSLLPQLRRPIPNLKRYLPETHIELNGYASVGAIYDEDDNSCDYNSDFETVEARSTGRPAHAYLKEDQMGLDIINKLKKFFNLNSSTSNFGTDYQEGKRKRRSDDWPACEPAGPQQIKYRKVDNRFPKYIPVRPDEDDINEFLPPLSHHNHLQKYQKYDKQYLLNKSAHNSKTLLDMSSRSTSIDKPPLRKSIFSAPNISPQFIKNTNYADIEFSDDDDIQSTTQASTKHVPKIFNIPIIRTGERLKSSLQKPTPPPLIESSTGSILQSSLIPGLETRRKQTYAETLRQTAGTGHVLGGRNSNSSSAASTSESSRLLNGLNNLRTNHWSTKHRSSILCQEKESEEREKYQQLLEQVVPRLYGSYGAENKIFSASSSNAAPQRRRPDLLMGAGISSSAHSSPAVASFSKNPPLSSTINLDDDDDVTITGISHLKTSLSSKTKQSVPTTVIVDDDDISDIIDLGNEERHVLSACAKIQKEKNSIVNLCEEKIEKTKNDALPFVEPVNSLRDRFNTSPHIKDNWLENWQSKWFQRKKNRHDEVKETVKVTEKLTAERRAAEAEIQERLRKFQIVDPELLVIDDFEDVIEEPEFVELNHDRRARINAAICGPLDQTLVSKFNLNITRRDIHTLCGHNWLNDEVINFYMNLLTERGEKKNESHGLPKVYAMNTFFVPRLLQAGHAGVKRWTRKVDIFEKDIVPVPVHVGGVHWCMAIINIKKRSIKYYDSMGTPNPSVLKALEQYLKDESMDKRKRSFDTNGFLIESVQGVPRQMNGSDCGVFSCMFAEYITRNREITFSQQNMEYFRQKMILEIVMGELLQ